MKFSIRPMKELGNLLENFSHKLFFFGTMEKINTRPIVLLIYGKRCYILQNRKSFFTNYYKERQGKNNEKDGTALRRKSKEGICDR